MHSWLGLPAPACGRQGRQMPLRDLGSVWKIFPLGFGDAFLTPCPFFYPMIRLWLRRHILPRTF
jgi:hypothetical protein